MPRPLTAIALGVGISAAVIAIMEARRAGGRAGAEPPSDDLLAPLKCTRQDGEWAPAGVRRMSVAQLDHAIQALQQSPPERHGEAVHETRKAIKRVRTLERLMSDATPRAQTQSRSTLLKQAAKELSAAREAEVALGTLEGLMRRHPKRLAGSRGVARLHAALLAERVAAERALQESGARERALQLLSAARLEIGAGPARGRRREARALDAGLIRIYARGRLAMRTARKRKGVAEMHEWRKRVKDLRHATEALGQEARGNAKRDRRRTRLRTLGRRADKLGEALGEEHDLALLAQRVGAEKKAIFAGDKAGRRALRRAIKRRRARLRKRALQSGRALYARKPKRFRARLPKQL